jgi:tRNA-splicing ligase RtcB
MNTPSPYRLSEIAGHVVRSVVASDEPERNFARSLEDLRNALPTKAAFADKESSLVSVATTPDFHPGKPVPVGVVADVEAAVLPHAIGSDIGCGMRMMALSGVKEEDLHDPLLERHARHLFFQGGRDIALRGRDRHALLRDGLPGLLESLRDRREGLLGKLSLDSAWSDLDRQSDGGVFAATDIDPDFADYARMDDKIRRDAILGTIGGGNHFVEIGTVKTVTDGGFAHACGLSENTVVCVIHTGSLDFGQRVGTGIREKLRAQVHPGEDDRILSKSADADLYHRYMKIERASCRERVS